MSISEQKLDQIREELTDAGVARAKAEANYQVVMAKLRMISSGETTVSLGKQNLVTGDDSVLDTEEAKETEKSAPKPSKPKTPSKPPKPETKSSGDQPAKPEKPSKPKSPPKPEKKAEQSGGITFDKYSSDLLAREAKDKIRELTEEDDAEAKIFAFIRGKDEVEDRTTVLGVAETHIGEDKVAELKDLDPKGDTEEEPEEEKEEKPSKPKPPPKPSKPKSPPKPKKETKEDVDETIDDIKNEDEDDEDDGQPADLKVELPDGVDRPEGAPSCFGNSDVYDQDSHKCMVCVFDFECEKAQEAIAGE